MEKVRIETEKLARSERRTFYSALSEILSGNGFDRFNAWAKRRCSGCAKRFAATTGGYAAQPGAPFRS